MGGSPYALDKVKNNPLTIDTEAANNIIRVYYAKDTNGNGKPDYKEETYNVNFVAGENGKLEGTTLYKDYLSGTAKSTVQKATKSQRQLLMKATRLING